MNITTSILKHMFVGVSAFLVSLGITMLVFSIAMKISFLTKMRKHDYGEETDDSLYDDYTEATLQFIDNIIYTKNRVTTINKEQQIFNQDKFGPMRPNTFILVIQVHDNLAFLKVLIASLKKVIGISNSMLIFCHDYYDTSVNTIIQGVSFAKYMQIYYPYSSQLYPKMFPGNDPKFCSGDFNCTDLCTDMKACLRNYQLVQQKHFWWWHVNFVFDQLEVTKHHDKVIVFLEENQYVLNDFLFMMKVLGTLMPANCPKCEIINLGARAPVLSQFHISNAKVVIERWNPHLPNIGFAFNRTIWQVIKNRSYHFCNFDDYRWGMSLNYLGSKRPRGSFIMFSSDAPRVLQINFCDGTIPECTLKRSIEDVQRFAKLVHRGLFPQKLEIINTDDGNIANITAAGEWKDVRDTAFCMFFSME